jgi:hypothetical protein
MKENIKTQIARQSVFSGDSFRIRIKGYEPFPQKAPYGAEIEGVLFDGYPQLVKEQDPKPRDV